MGAFYLLLAALAGVGCSLDGEEKGLDYPPAHCVNLETANDVVDAMHCVDLDATEDGIEYDPKTHTITVDGFLARELGPAAPCLEQGGIDSPFDDCERWIPSNEITITAKVGYAPLSGKYVISVNRASGAWGSHGTARMAVREQFDEMADVVEDEFCQFSTLLEEGSTP